MMLKEQLQKYQAVIGLEVHAQLSTQSKLFCGDSTRFGADANTHISPITMAHPGILPKINEKAIEYAVKMGIACQCSINQFSFFARKNYLYPDLPKGFQTTQHTTPICLGGSIPIKTQDGKRKFVQLHHIHLEEDAGKSIHDIYKDATCVDLNRAGTPLIEIVSEPNIHSAEEASQYVAEIRKLVRWIGISDGNMEEGSLRCDANISIRPMGSNTLGTRVEVKNLNSLRNIKKAIEFEIERLIQLTEKGEPIIQQTRSFDAQTDSTFAIREKEDANDYRYFPEPDLPPIVLTEPYIQSIKNSLPILPHILLDKFIDSYKLSSYDAEQLCADKNTALFFETIAAIYPQYKTIANWINGPLKQYCNEHKVSITAIFAHKQQFIELMQLVESGKINFSTAATKVLPSLAQQHHSDALTIATQANLLQTNNDADLNLWIQEVIDKMPEKVQEYKKGKKGLIGLFIGEVKKISKGKADPQKVTQMLQEKLK